MNKYFHSFLMGVSVLPVLAIMPVMAYQFPDDGAVVTGDVSEMYVITGGKTVTFENFSASQISETYSGAAIENIDSVTKIKNSTFTNNTSGNMGGVILTQGESSRLTIDNTKFTGNRGDVGGVIAELLHSGQTIITKSTFSNNQANEIGALYLLSATALIEDSTFTGNKSLNTESGITYDGGGAVWVGSESTTNIKKVSFVGNTSGTDGGAVASRRFSRGDNYAATLDISDSEFKNNTAGRDGGAIDNYMYNDKAGDGYVKIVSSSFTSNSALNGGAIYNHKGVDGNVLHAGNAQVGSIYLEGVTFTNNTATTAGGAIYNEGEISFAGTNTFSGNKANNVANDIQNLGAVTVESGTTTLDGGVTGTGELIVENGATLNIGTASVTQGSITLNGDMLATLRDGDAQITADTFDGNGNLKLSFAGAGTYSVFGNAAFRRAGIDVSSSVYDLTWANNDKDLIVSIKSVEDIAAETGIEENSAKAVIGMNTSTSEKLNDLGVQIQEKLAENMPESVREAEHAAKAVHPETESVHQSVATAVQTAVTNLASARMASPIVGRSGGDVELTSGGVWAQGLFNKSKQNGDFRGYTRGIAVGLDGTFNKDWMVGAGYSYAHSDINGTARDTEIDSNTVFLYGQYKPAEWYINAVANYTWSDFSEDGVALGTPVSADYDVDAFGGTVAAGYEFNTGITPELGLRYMHVNADDYKNSMDVKISAKDSDFLTGVLGAKYAFSVVADRYTTFVPQLNAAIKYDMLSDKNIATVVMPGVDSYTLNGERLSRLGGEFGVGLTMKHRSLDFSINYDIDVRKDYTSQTGMLKFRYNF